MNIGATLSLYYRLMEIQKAINEVISTGE